MCITHRGDLSSACVLCRFFFIFGTNRRSAAHFRDRHLASAVRYAMRRDDDARPNIIVVVRVNSS